MNETQVDIYRLGISATDALITRACMRFLFAFGTRAISLRLKLSNIKPLNKLLKAYIFFSIQGHAEAATVLFWHLPTFKLHMSSQRHGCKRRHKVVPGQLPADVSPSYQYETK